MSGVEGDDIAVVGAGIAGLACAWALSRRHRVTLYEAERHLGGHSQTVEVDGTAVDIGFIVYNEPAYPNLTALFRHLGVATLPSEMSFSVSLRDGALEYAGSDLAGLFAQKRNLVRPRFWAMLRDLLRFYRGAPRQAARLGEISLGAFLDAGGYGAAFRDDHLYPMIAAVWSCPAGGAARLPAAAFIRFCETHGLLKLAGRPVWRSVRGGSREYVARLRAEFAGRVRLGAAVTALARDGAAVRLRNAAGEEAVHDQVVLACHADTALGLLSDATAAERETLGAFRYTENEVVLHSDAAAMPRRRAAWAAWNYGGGEGAVSVTYWMNKLQTLPAERPFFVSLNPLRPLGQVHHRRRFSHPVFDVAALRAQPRLWALQGLRRSWYCGAYFGAGFHEDGLQAGLAVAEALGAQHRPWRVPDESGRIALAKVPALAA